MDLPIELIELICSYANVSNLRILCRLCKIYNGLATKYIELSKLYGPKCLHGYHLSVLAPEGYQQYYCMEKFTIELGFDDYFIPNAFYVEHNNAICSVFAYLGQFDLLIQAVSKKCIVTSDTLTCATKTGRIDILEYCRGFQPFAWSNLRRVSVCAAECGHLHILEYIDTINNDIIERDILSVATKHGHLNIVRWVITRNNYLSNKCCRKAAKYGHVHILEWAKSNNYNTFVGETAGYYGQVGVLQWLLDNEYQLHTYDVAAIKMKHHNVIRWMLNTFGSSVIDRIKTIAIDYDKKFVFQILLEYNYVPDESVFHLATEKQAMCIIKWMIKQKLLTKPINFDEKFRPVAQLLLENDLLCLNALTCLKLIKLNLTLCIDKINFTQKLSYHFIVSKSSIVKCEYNTEARNSQQKLICLDEFGQIETVNLDDSDSDCKCWWYLLALTETKSTDMLIKLKACVHHSMYMCKYTS